MVIFMVALGNQHTIWGHVSFLNTENGFSALLEYFLVARIMILSIIVKPKESSGAPKVNNTGETKAINGA